MFKMACVPAVVLLATLGISTLTEASITGNLALGKPTLQSGTGWGGASSRAVDGNQNPDYGANSCTAAPAIANTWWRVDLLSSQSVCMVKVTNRADCCSERLNNFEVRVGNDGSGDGSRNPICNTVNIIGKGETKTVFCKNSVAGRYVYIRLQRNNILTLCEVQVFGSCFCSPRPAKLLNLALKKPTAQINTYVGASASRAVDGNLNANYGGGSCTHTLSSTHAWWRVDLQKTEEICMVKVTNRGDCCAGRLHNFEVWIGAQSSGDGATGNTLCQTVGTINLGETRTVLCEKPISGRYVFIRLIGKDFLTLCEVQVFGTGTTNCPEMTPPKNGMIVQGQNVALALCKAGTFPKTQMSAYFICTNGVWVDQDKNKVTSIPDCSSPSPPRGTLTSVFDHWKFTADCNSSVAKANAKAKLLYLGICHKDVGCSDLQITTKCG